MRGLKNKMDVGLRMTGIITVILFACAAATYAAGDLSSNIKSFTPGTTIKSSDMNSNFQAIINGMPAIKTNPPNDTLFTLSGSVQNLTSVTVTPPMDGVLLLIASAQARLDSGVDSGPAGAANVQMCVTQTSLSCGKSDESRSINLVAPAPPSGTSVYLPITFITARQCSANIPVTYYLTALEEPPALGLSQINGAYLWVIFLPGVLQ